MAYKRLSRKDYQNLIGIANEKKKPRAKRRRKTNQRGGITVPDLLLAKMISNDNRNQLQRDAMIDTMNKSQVRRMGKLVKLLSKNQEFVKAITENKVPVSTKKRIFKQKGGILPMLLPFAAKAAAPLAGSLLSGILGKIF